MKKWIKPIAKLGACLDALEWAEDYDSLAVAWVKCERGDWMLWLLGKLSGPPESDSRKKLVLVACQCARLALPYVKKGETRPLKAIETAEAWAKGESGITLIDVKNAAFAAFAAAFAATAAAYAATAAAFAAFAAFAAAFAAFAAAYAATAAAFAATAAANAAFAANAAANAANAANAAANAANQYSMLKKCADIVRGSYEPPNL